MKLAAVTFTYHPDISSLKENILKYIDGVDHLIVWDNTPDSEMLSKLDFNNKVLEKIQVMGIGRNVGIAYAANRAIEWAHKNGYTHVLTMDQDSTWDDFKSYRRHIELDCQDNKVGIYSPRLSIDGKIREDCPTYCFTSGAVVPLDVLEEVGLFREDYVLDDVDLEFCFRCREAGYIICYMPDILFHSLGRAKIVKGKYRTANYPASRMYSIARNEIFLWKDFRHSAIKHRTFMDVNRYLYYFAKHIIIGEDDKLRKIAAMISGYLKGMLYSSRKKQILHLTDN